ncbi:glycerol-3-phosphate dehydrogenase/oxidase [Ruania alkalisoli]|uniref:Glycerol-3-phosphate dehydrogenase/oxidase n=1 Tax=Ruania alkalisoli TaxID=2779775 RepID=A0A7M1T015_9MICO|nr:glycerol-3-phosphate dehydrogenase/oxidase [Ruania alkalisoli]QOR72544.1 glycerol-3-phosphate dehydrogenase/oxidase [Ruania alkalisoli]
MTSGEPLDVLVVGGGITGAGIVLDAVTRGLSTGIVEMQDWAGGTSSWSSKLVHGGVRYLYNLDFKLVAEGLRERGLLLTKTAPHLVKAQPFLWPLKTPVIERAYSALGIGLYDAMAVIGHRGMAVPVQKHYSRAGVEQLFPDVRSDQLVGGIRFYDARVDDARLVMTLVRTAQSFGAHAASRTQVVDYLKEDGRVVGAEVVDLETGTRRTIRAKRVINATGVWTEDTEALGGNEGGLQVLASKGAHVVIPKERIKGDVGLFLRTEKSVLFIIPWQRYWIIGTTDTPWDEERLHPVATRADIDYILDHANAVLSSNLTFDDVIGVYAGLRPLVQPGTKDGGTASTKVSRDHTVVESAPGLTVISGGKLTSYRLMAEHAVDHALGEADAHKRPSVTPDTPLIGAPRLEAITRQAPQIAAKYGWDKARMEHLLSRYGSDLQTLLALVDEDPELGKPLDSAPAYLRAEAVMAVEYEGALHLEDILMRRIRLFFEQRDRGVSALEELAQIVGPRLGWDEQTVRREVSAYAEMAAAEEAALGTMTDAEAEAARLAVADLVPLANLES